MASLVAVVASTHNPRIFWNADQANPDDMDRMRATFGHVRDLLAATRPDVLVTLANDHFDNFFFDNMPTFSIGTGPRAQGPFWYESDIMHLPHYAADIDQRLAGFILRGAIESGIYIAQAHDLHIDHAFTVPLSFMRPNADLPIVPIVSNAFGYPVAENRQWYEFGQFLQRVIGAWPDHVRVAVICSFNLTVEVGGPKMGKIDQEFARWMLELMRDGKRDEILEKLTVRRLIEAGNSTIEFLNYVAGLGIVGDRLPAFIEHKPVKGVGTCPIAFWNL
jgi:protocatechuate 4,5-dioxygenase beta chain